MQDQYISMNFGSIETGEACEYLSMDQVIREKKNFRHKSHQRCIARSKGKKRTAVYHIPLIRVDSPRRMSSWERYQRERRVGAGFGLRHREEAITFCHKSLRRAESTLRLTRPSNLNWPQECKNHGKTSEGPPEGTVPRGKCPHENHYFICFKDF